VVEIVTFDPSAHLSKWQDFIISSYANPNYVLLSLEYLRWQFLENPANATGGYTLWLVLDEGVVIAQLGYVPFIGQAPDGTSFAGAYPINLMARSEYRGTGLGVVLLKKLLRETLFVVNSGANQTGTKIGEDLGMQDCSCLKRYICVTDQTAARSLAIGGKLPATVENMALNQPSAEHVIPTARLPAATPDSFKLPVPVYTVERTRAFFRWRYETHPGFSYEFLLSPDLQSILVFHEEHETGTGVLVLRVVDLLAHQKDQETLLSSCVQIARERGAAIVDFFCSLDCYDAALREVGFFDEAEHPGERIAALFQPLDYSDASIRVSISAPHKKQMSADCWYITKADSDQDRPNDRRAIRARV
jgi:GNAT superfamily N-acetyltransferase